MAIQWMGMVVRKIVQSKMTLLVSEDQQPVPPYAPIQVLSSSLLIPSWRIPVRTLSICNPPFLPIWPRWPLSILMQSFSLFSLLKRPPQPTIPLRATSPLSSPIINHLTTNSCRFSSRLQPHPLTSIWGPPPQHSHTQLTIIWLLSSTLKISIRWLPPWNFLPTWLPTPPSGLSSFVSSSSASSWPLKWSSSTSLHTQPCCC